MNDWFYSVFGIKTATLVAGLAGGIVRALMMPGISAWQAFTSCAIGALTAGYLTPVALAYWPLSTGEGTEGAVGFVIGLTSMLICEGLIRLIKRWRDEPDLPR